MVGDFLVLNIILFFACRYHHNISAWSSSLQRLLIVTSNLAFLLSETQFSTIIHFRWVGAGNILRRVILLTMTWAVLTFFSMKFIFVQRLMVGRHLLLLGTILFICLLGSRFIERRLITRLRKYGRNTRTILLVGNDIELVNVCRLLVSEPTRGYRVVGYYADQPMAEPTDGALDITRLGTISELIARAGEGTLEDCDELYLCVSRRERRTVQRISLICDQRGIHFFYVPLSVESIGLKLNRELLEDIEVFTTYKNPLQNPLNKFVKRSFDIVASLAFLLCTAIFMPIIFLIVKVQSPGPLFFRQKRTGLDGREFYCYKFRSMHVNQDADKLQATKDDPRKYPFGNFMRKYNIDELPQFWNVLKGDMSIVGPRPHMLAHTQQYSQLIDKYMVRHFVKPGITGWAQVTGFRGETKELWQMEGRVMRDIWYIENWDFWLDLNIIWRTIKTFFVHDDQAY